MSKNKKSYKSINAKNKERFFGGSLYREVTLACERFWQNTQVIRFEDGVAIRSDIPRIKKKQGNAVDIGF